MGLSGGLATNGGAKAGGSSAAAPLSLMTDFGLTPVAVGAGTPAITAQTTAIQSAITSAIAQGRALSLDYQNWYINSALTISGALKLIGPSKQENWSPIDTGNPNGNAVTFPTLSPPVLGGCITQMATSTNILNITALGKQVDLDGFGLVFNTPYASTGHGIFAQSAVLGSGFDNGVMRSNWKDITVFGTDGSHYGFDLWNQMLCRYDHLSAYGGGGIHFAQNSHYTYYGNATFTDCYAATYISGTAHAWHLETQSDAGTFLDYCIFIRPQGWVAIPAPALAGTTPPSGGTQDILHSTNGSSMQGFEFYGADWELSSGLTSHVQYPSGLGCFWSSNGGGNSGSGSSGTSMGSLTTSGTALVNTSGTHQMYYAEVQLNPTAGAAANIVAQVGGSPFSGSFFEAGQLNAPANDTVGRVQTLNVLVPSGCSIKFTWSNCTILSSANWPIAVIGKFF